MSVKNRLLGNRDKIRVIDTTERAVEKKTTELFRALKGEPVKSGNPAKPKSK